VSDFFEPPPREEPQPARSNDWDGPPKGSMPVTLPIERIVARTDETAVYLASISAYPSGFELDVFVVAAEESDLFPFDFDHQTVAEHTGEIPPEQLRLGFQFADNSKATNTGKYFGWEEESDVMPDAPVMQDRGSSSGGENWHSAFWVWPLPPPGRLEFVCEWPQAGIPLTRIELDGAAILEASKKAPR
jgi:hypothetical protein